MNALNVETRFLAFAILLAVSSIIAAPAVAACQQQDKVKRLEKTLGYSLGISVLEAKSETGGKAHRVTAISPNSPANEAGLLPNDFILSINKIRTGETRTLADLIQQSEGKRVELVIERDGKQKTLFVKPVASATEIIERRIEVERDSIKKSAPKKAADKSKPMGTSEKNDPPIKQRKSPTDPSDANPSKEFDPSKLLDNALLSEVTIQHHKELGVLSIRGEKADVEKVEKAIREFIESAKLFTPQQQIIRLRNTWANQAVESITEIYDKQFASREGEVNITAMHDPEALMVVGLPGAIAAVRGLAKAYDSGQIENK